MIGVAVIGSDYGLITHLFGSLHDLAQTLVNHLHGLFYGGIDARMTHHVGIGEIYHNPIVLVGLECLYELFLDFVCRHLGLQVVGSHLGRGYQYAVFARKRFFTPSVDERGDMGIFLGLCDVQLLQALAGDVFAEGIIQVILGEEYVYAREGVIVGRHAVVLQVGNGLHALLRHVFLREHYGQFLGAVASEVKEDDHVAFLDSTVDVAVYEWLHKLIGVLVLLGMSVVARLYSFHHVVHLAPLAADEQVVSQLDAIPVLIAVHGIETTDDRRNTSYTCFVHVPLYVGNETLARPRIGITTVHEAVYIAVRDVVLLGYIKELHKMA